MSWPGLQVRLEARLESFALDVRFETASNAVGIFGPSGSGKTSVLEAIAGWRRGLRGELSIGGRTLLDSAAGVDVAPEDRGVGYVPQDALLFPHWSVARNIDAGAERRGALDVAHRERVIAVLELGELLEREPTRLSGGERQRVALARALCSRPDLMLLDEPLVALDLALRRRVLADLARVREAFRVPLLFVSHDATEVQTLCDEVVVLERGRVVDQGAPARLFSGGRLEVTDFENVLRGLVDETTTSTARVEVAPGFGVQVPRAALEVGDTCVFGLRADDVLVSIQPPAGISARNVLPARVRDVAARGGDVFLQAALGARRDSELSLSVSLTESSRSELALEVGSEVYLVFKTQSCHLLARWSG